MTKTLLQFVLILLLSLAEHPALLGADEKPAIKIPWVTDQRLVLELFAAEPDIVTPTGMTIDAQGRVLVIESHTHFPPKDYDGPPTDRIRRFEDTNGDGRADRMTPFFEGTTHTMSAALYQDGSVFVATRNEVLRLRDTDGDGTADERTLIARLESKDTYPHSGIAGFAFDTAGDMFFGLGENHAMPFKLTGSDGVVLTGIEGGHVYRCRPDGSKLARVSIGCWNPHALAIDAVGRMFAVDNDPDSSPPSRLLHIVQGADYGYKYRNGRKGTHPFTSWNGEVPDTLPMVCGTGESPAGILVCGKPTGGHVDKLPADYRGDLLVTSWGDHRIERYRLKARGASFSAERTDVVIGDENFRPVGISVGGDGAVYFTDWVDKSYTLHKKGRIWRLRTVDASAAPALKSDIGTTKTTEESRAESLRTTSDPTQTERLWRACDEADPFIQQAAREGLKRVGAVTPSLQISSLTPSRRLAALCVLRDLNSPEAEARLPEFLRDSDSGVRLVALKWIGEERLVPQRANLDSVLTAGPITSRLFAAYLATKEKLDRPPRKDSDEWSHERYIVDALSSADIPPAVLPWAVRTLRPDHPTVTCDRLLEWLSSDDARLRLEAVRTLRESQIEDRAAMLSSVAGDDKLPILVRCEAIVGIVPDSAESIRELIDLARHANREIASEALRSLRGAELAASPRERLTQLAKENAALAELVDRVISPPASAATSQPESADAWIKKLEGPADAAAGERVFFHARSGACSRCHTVDGRGAQIGPDLTIIGRNLDRLRLIESIVSPSKEIAPQFVTWSIQTRDGRALTGTLLGINADDSERYADAAGKVFSLKPAEIEARRAQSNSIMPDGFSQQMTLQEFRDLLAFLQQK